jgi:hypothetical protein
VTVSTTSATPLEWDVSLDLSAFPLNGIPSDVWNAAWSFDAATLNAAGLEYNATVVVGAPVTFGFCADRPLVPLTVTVPTIAGQDVLTSGNNPTTTTIPIPLQGPLGLTGAASATVEVRDSTNGNPPRTVQLALRVDGTTVATWGTTDLRLTRGQWTTLTYDLDWIDVAVPPGAVVDLVVTIERLELRIGGPTTLSLPGR